VAAGTAVPGRITGATPAVERWARLREGRAAGSPVGPVGPGSHLDYLVRVTKPGRVRITVNGSSPEGAGPTVAVSGATVEVKAGGSSWTATTRKLEPGMYVLRLSASGGRVDVADIALERG
jgi:hypothetical protein